MIKTKPYRIGLIQMAMESSSEKNRDQAIKYIRRAASEGAQIICLPELFTSQYFCQVEDHKFFELAEPAPGPTIDSLSVVAKKEKVVIVAPFFERRAPGVYHNSVAVINADGKMLGTYRKMHIPDDPAYYEKFYFTPGDLGFRTFDTTYGRIGSLICWDQWYPEAARIMALLGSEVIFYPTAIGWHPAEKQQFGQNQLNAWRTIQIAHAIANGAYVAVSNRVGFEKLPNAGEGIDFWGNSFVADPQGVVIASASSGQETTLVVEVDPARIEEVRQHWPFLRDRRIESYGGILERFLDKTHD